MPSVQLDRLFELMLGTLVVSDSPENQTPDHPAVSVFFILLDRLLNFFNCTSHFSLFEKSKSPIPVTVVRLLMLFKVVLGETADTDCFLIVLVHVVDKGKIIVGVRVQGVELSTFSEMFNCNVVLFHFKVGESHVIVQLCVFPIDRLCFSESSGCILELLLLVKTHS